MFDNVRWQHTRISQQKENMHNGSTHLKMPVLSDLNAFFDGLGDLTIHFSIKKQPRE